MNYNWDWGVFFKSTGIGSETYLDWYIAGLGWTIAIALVGWIIALALGSLLGVMRTVPNRLVSGIATAYVEVFRNVPLLVQLFIWYFLVPDLLPEGLQTWFKQDLNPTTSAYLSVVVCLGLFTAARVCEQVRTGIQALPYGQTSAARAMGFRLPQIYRHVLLPQAFRIIIPPLTSGVPQHLQELLGGVADRPDGAAGADQADRRVLRQPVRGLHPGHADLLHAEHEPDADHAPGGEKGRRTGPDLRRR
ncbi:ABC transporter permease [Pseudomonas aeruginosa]|nr:ABC transporter permease [Pseudomonas aeruginosa]